MQISDVSTRLTLNSAPAADRSLSLASLRPGQILQAVVMSLNTNGRVSLRIGNSDVVAQTPLLPTVGQRLSLAVVKAGALPELHLIQAMSTTDLKTLAWKSVLPRQVPLDRLLDNLTRVSSEPFVAQSPELRDVIRRLFAGLPSPTSLKSDQQVLRAFSETGLLMESGLLHGGISSVDLKANLLRLLAQLRNILKSPIEKAPGGQPPPAEPPRNGIRPAAHPVSTERMQTSVKPSIKAVPTGEPTPGGTAQASARPEAQPARTPVQSPLPAEQTTGRRPTSTGSSRADVEPPPQQTPTERLPVAALRELASTTEGALARLQLNQLASLPAAEREPQIWQLDLPLRQDDRIDVFRFRIAREDPPGNQTERPQWTLTMRFDLKPLGPVEVRLVLLGSSIATHFWAERSDTRTRIEQHLPDLEKAFTRSGLSAARFTVHQGMPPEPPPIRSGFPLLDVKA